MKEDKDKMHVELDNLAFPEIRFDNDEDFEDDEDKEIEYSGAVPEIHIRKD